MLGEWGGQVQPNLARGCLGNKHYLLNQGDVRKELVLRRAVGAKGIVEREGRERLRRGRKRETQLLENSRWFGTVISRERSRKGKGFSARPSQKTGGKGRIRRTAS